MLAAVRAPYPFLADDLALGASIGLSLVEIALILDGADHPLRAADQAMHAAKVAGGNQIVVESMEQVS